MKTFTSAKILLPKVENIEKWAVIACDQYTSQPEYWERVRENTKGEPSTVNLILPEAEMDHMDDIIGGINENMIDYINKGYFIEYDNAYVYVERTLVNGTIRKGIVGAVDLEQYDYTDNATTDIRATERTVEDRIPPRMNIRRDATLELPHILLLCDDEKHELLESVENLKDKCKMLYDFDLMEEGGHISGWLVEGEVADIFEEKLEEYAIWCRAKYEGTGKAPMLYAMGDGNHSLATAKACYEELKRNNPEVDFSNHPARWALLELENIHDDSQVFEPIHRVITRVDAKALLTAIKENICAEDGFAIKYYMGNEEGEFHLDKKLGELPIAILQNFLDEYFESNDGEIDYIHGDDVVKELSNKENTIGFLLPTIEKNQLFKGIVMDGVLPRKTFSMGHACEKRFYLEARKIKS